MIPERFDDRPDLPPDERPTADEYDYPEDSVGAIPAGVKIRCERCMATFVLQRGPAISCPHCGVSLEARR